MEFLGAASAAGARGLSNTDSAIPGISGRRYWRLHQHRPGHADPGFDQGSEPHGHHRPDRNP